MLPDKEAALLLVGDGLSGAGVLQWVAARADLWLLVFRCAQLIGKAHSSATQLEQIFRANEEEVGEENTTSGATVEVEEPESWREQDTDWWPEVKEGFGNQMNLCRDRGLNPGPSAQKSDTLPLDHQVTLNLKS
uniref:Uncharacterized protein n=1 Tax=Timema bartmani TaxID=61472 RepID=A0A7R9EW85_9NEOP|nr:unnamed protein product [Timema bartmani]